MNKNSGYVGWSMSRRAVQAYEDGEAPLSRIGSGKYIKAAAELLGRSSWHHTSKHCNRTDFYKVAAVRAVAHRLKSDAKRLGSLELAVEAFKKMRQDRRERQFHFFSNVQHVRRLLRQAREAEALAAETGWDTYKNEAASFRERAEWHGLGRKRTVSQATA
jgi:hypothetical protein